MFWLMIGSLYVVVYSWFTGSPVLGALDRIAGFMYLGQILVLICQVILWVLGSIVLVFKVETQHNRTVVFISWLRVSLCVITSMVYLHGWTQLDFLAQRYSGYHEGPFDLNTLLTAIFCFAFSLTSEILNTKLKL